MRAAWHALHPAAGPAPAPPLLGFRGLALECDEESWLVFRGLVVHHCLGATEVKADTDGDFENLLLDSAPPGLLSPPILALMHRS
ncbi:MAG: hypothetical protein SFU86_19160 [Pirellulaceae bacterium]|nr:hypothetical protein [Pirellulaceae bacterium]